MNVYEKNLDKNNANFVPLTPLTFLKELKIFIQIMRNHLRRSHYTWIDVYKR